MKSVVLVMFVTLFWSSLNAQWKKVNISTNKDLYDVQIVGHVAFAGGNSSALLRSDDTGKSWKSLTLTIPENIRSVYFVDTSIGFIIGENARIQKTIDGGKTWVQKYIRTAAYGYDMAFLNNRGIAVGKDMLAISTIDLGENWTVDTTLSKFRKLNSVTIMPDGNCWAVGDTGYILNKNINAKKWKVIKYPTKVDLNHISSIGVNTIIIAGGMPDSAIVGKFYNILLISNDTGKTWLQNTVGEMKIINSAYFLNKDTGFLAGSNGLISKCSDGINNRGLQLTGSSSSLNEIFFSNDIGLVVGDGGALYRTSNNGGKVLNNKEVLNSGLKTIVFPNPANGSFSIQTDFERFNVDIFDMAGRLIYHDGEGSNGKMIEIKGTGVYTVIIRNAFGEAVVRKLMLLE